MNVGILHGGDNDSTGAIGGAWYGAVYGFNGVPSNHYQDLEYLDRLKELGEQIYSLCGIPTEDNNNNTNNNETTSTTSQPTGTSTSTESNNSATST